MKTLIAAAVLSLCTLASAQDHRPYIQEHSLASGGAVVLTLNVGNLTVQGVEGNKDVHAGVGNVRIDVANPAEYGHVEIHTRVGDVHDFLNHGDTSEGFVGKTEDFTLSGRYHLRASTGVGDVRISPDGKS